MEDISKTRLRVKATDEAISLANEDNEWVTRLGELAELKAKKEKKRSRPKKFQRVSARQQNAVGRR